MKNNKNPLAPHVLAGNQAVAGWPGPIPTHIGGRFGVPMPQPSPLGNFFHNAKLRFDAAPVSLPEQVRAVLAQPVEYYQTLANLAPVAGEKPLTNVAFVLDKSTSMLKGKSTTIEGFNAQVQVVRAGALEAGETTFTDVHFSDNVEVRCVASSMDHMVDLTDSSYTPSGMTALYDALGDTIAALLSTARMNSAMTATLVTLFTDGDENSSRRYTAEVLRDLIKRLEATGRWTFALVGPRGSVHSLASMLAVNVANVKAYNPDSLAERQQVFGSMAVANSTYMSMRATGATQSMSMYNEPPVDTKI